MTKENIRACMQTLSSKEPAEALVIIKQKLQDADDEIAEEIIFAKYNDTLIVLLLSILTGGFGIDRFYLGDIALGVCKLLFNWLTLGIWYFIDIFLCYKKAKQRNLDTVMQILADHNIR